MGFEEKDALARSETREMSAPLQSSAAVDAGSPKDRAESGHTTGPWGYELSGDEREFEIAPVNDIHNGEWSREVAMTASGKEADARLIAAAPEMLSALRLWVEFVDLLPGETQFGVVSAMRLLDARFQTVAAIKKAEGAE
jgi:hypothetical protein